MRSILITRLLYKIDFFFLLNIFLEIFDFLRNIFFFKFFVAYLMITNDNDRDDDIINVNHFGHKK